MPGYGSATLECALARANRLRHHAQRVAALATVIQLRSIGVRRVVGGLLTIGFLSWLYARLQGRRPSASELMAMSDSEFASFIRKRGLRTVSDPPTIAEQL